MRRLIWLVLAAFALLALAWSLVVPPFETPDEIYHYGFVRHLAQGNPLPVQSAESTGPWEQEGSQAPLYYLAAGALTSLIDQADLAALAVRNPRANIGDPLYPGNKNFMLYSGAKRPLTGVNLALHVGRWFSLLLGALTVWFTWLTARLAFGARLWPALAAAALVASVPQFGFLSGSLTNDALVTTASAAGVWWLARLITLPPERPVRRWEWAALGVILGIAALSKLQGLGLFVLAALAGLGMATQRRDWLLPLRALLPVAIPPALIAGWWYLRNIRLYDDWTGLRYLLELNGRRAGNFDLADWWLEFRGLRYSFWGLFGWFNILLPDWVYWALDFVSAVALLGAIVTLGRIWLSAKESPAQRNVLTLAALWSLLSFALLLYFTLQATGSQGRLLFPALSTLAILAVLGLDFWLARLPRIAAQAVWGALLALLVGSSLYSLGWLVPNAYRPADAVAAPPSSAQPVNLTYGDDRSLHLVAVDLPNERFRPGQQVPLTLYLLASAPPTTDFELFLQLLDETGREIANITSHPGWGRNPTTLWQPGALYPDRYLLRITGPVSADSPLLARLYTGFVDPATAAAGNLPLKAFAAGDDEVTPFVATVAVSPSETPTLDSLDLAAHGATFGGVVRIAGASAPTSVSPGNPMTLTVLYEAVGTPAADYTAFVHLVDSAGGLAAGFDRAPADLRFPTPAWRAGDRIVARYVLAVPTSAMAGDYTIWSGLYETGSGGALRLPVSDNAGLPSGDGQVQLGIVTVE